MDKETNNQDEVETVEEFKKLLRDGPKSDIVIRAMGLYGTMVKIRLPEEQRHWTMVTVDFSSNTIYGVMDGRIVVPGRTISNEYGRSWEKIAISVRHRLAPELCSSK